MIIPIGAGIGALALLLLIISVGTTGWLTGNNGVAIGLFRSCTSDNCEGSNRNPQAGLSVFGLLLLAFSVMAAIAFVKIPTAAFVSLGLMYFASVFIMSAYATWGDDSRDPELYFYPLHVTITSHTSIGYSYNLCVAAHYFIWTALTFIAFGAGYQMGSKRNEGDS